MYWTGIAYILNYRNIELDMKIFYSIKSILCFLMLCVLCFDLDAENPFKVRAFHLDMRVEVMTVEALENLAEELAREGINTIIMEYEATFPFIKHATICNRNAYTKEEVEHFVSHCSELGIDVIPLQHCFGHCEHILRHDRYGALRESAKDPSQVCPLKIDEAVEVFTEIFSEVAALHPSKYFHIGADETYLLGTCKNCCVVAEKEGKSRLFVDYIKAMCDIVDGMGKTPVIWADIILNYPELLSELPDNLVFVDWNYGWEPDRFGKLDNLWEQGVRMWGASALRSGPDNWYMTQWMKHFNNIRDFIPFARKNGYEGMVQTSWSTSGTFGYYLDSGYEVLDMQPVRLVYPMSAFGILQEAFCQAVNSETEFVPEVFIREYARKRMGLGEAGENVLMRYFSMPQEQIYIDSSGAADASGRTLPELLEECMSVRVELASLHPIDHRNELSHWLLMLDMRINYLKFKEVEGRVQSSEYDRSQVSSLVSELEKILKQENSIAKRFAKLNKGYVKDSDIEYMNYIKSFKIKELYRRLKNSYK